MNRDEASGATGDAVRRGWFVTYLTNPTRLRAISRIVLVMTAGLWVYLFVTARENRTVLGPMLGADFSHFYAAGWIVRQGDHSRLYDVNYQNEVYHQLFPALDETAALPFLHAPFFAIGIAPLTVLSYRAAYAVWVGIAVACYAAAIRLLTRGAPTFQEPVGRTGVLMSLSFLPFVMEVCLGGQSSALAVLGIIACMTLQRKQHPVAGGICLSICFYKVTLLLFVLPMLVLTRQYRVLVGTLIGTAALIMASAAWLGPQVYLDYGTTLSWFAKFREMKPEAFPMHKFVDVTSFLQLLTAWPLDWIQGVVVIGALGIGALLAWIWIRHGWQTPRPWMGQHAACAWALALLWTPCLNLYCGIYDSILVVPGILLIVEKLAANPTSRGRRFLFAAIILYFGAWVSQLLAIVSGLQVYTLLLLWLAVEGTRLCYPTPAAEPATSETP